MYEIITWVASSCTFQNFNFQHFTGKRFLRKYSLANRNIIEKTYVYAYIISSIISKSMKKYTRTCIGPYVREK